MITSVKNLYIHSKTLIHNICAKLRVHVKVKVKQITKVANDKFQTQNLHEIAIKIHRQYACGIKKRLQQSA